MATFSAFWALAHVARGEAWPTPAPLGSASAYAGFYLLFQMHFLRLSTNSLKTSSHDMALPR